MRNLLLSGGVAHDFPAMSTAVAAVLAEVDIESEICTDPVAGLRHLGEFDLVTVNMLRWRMNVERYLHLQEQWALVLPAESEQALFDHIRHGRGLLGLHGASICFDAWPQWQELLGGVWDWDRSTHPPLGLVDVEVVPQHPITEGIPSFALQDEAYGFLSLAPDAVGLLTAEHGGTRHPLLWARSVGAGRSVYDALGHHALSYQQPDHRVVVQRAARWAVGDSDAEVRAIR